MTECTEYDVIAVKRWLISYINKERDIDNQLERLDRLEIKLRSLGSPELSGMPKSPGANYDRTADLVARKVDLENEIKAAIQSQEAKRKEINRALKLLANPDEKAVIQMRYLDVSSWGSVSDMLFGSKDDFLGKEDTYLRRTHKIHHLALLNLAQIIHTEENPPLIGGITTN